MASTDELKLLRTALSLNQTLFTIQRNSKRHNTSSIRVDCYASNNAGSPGLKRITCLVADVLKYRRGPCGLILNIGEDIDRNLVATLSKKLDLDLKHERMI